jgi:hypothetical protein
MRPLHAAFVLCALVPTVVADDTPKKTPLDDYLAKPRPDLRLEARQDDPRGAGRTRRAAAKLRGVPQDSELGLVDVGPLSEADEAKDQMKQAEDLRAMGLLP